MRSRDKFEYIRSLVLEQEKLARELEELQAATGPKGQQYGSVGHGSGAGDGSAQIIRAMEARVEYDRKQLVLERLLEVAYAVLYGSDCSGGLANKRSGTDADCICGYYLLGMTWPEVAAEMVRPDSKDGAQWCKRRAYRAFQWLDSQQ